MDNSALLTDEENLLTIQMETGIKEDADGKGLLNLYWKKYANLSSTDLRALYCKADVCRYLVGKYRLDMNVSVGPDRIDFEKRYKHAVEMLAGYQNLIDLADGLVGPGSVSSVAGITDMPLPGGYFTEWPGRWRYDDRFPEGKCEKP